MDMSLEDMIASGGGGGGARSNHRGGGGGGGGGRGQHRRGGGGGGRNAHDDLRGRLSGSEWQPPLPLGRPPNGGGGYGGYGGGGGARHFGGNGQKAATLKGWAPSGKKWGDGKDCYAGNCEGCGAHCEVHFRPVRGGNPPVCHDCHHSLKSVQEQAAGPDRGGRQAQRYNPYGGGTGPFEKWESEEF